LHKLAIFAVKVAFSLLILLIYVLHGLFWYCCSIFCDSSSIQGKAGAIVIATEKILNIAKVMVDKSRKTFLY